MQAYGTLRSTGFSLGLVMATSMVNTVFHIFWYMALDYPEGPTRDSGCCNKAEPAPRAMVAELSVSCALASRASLWFCKLGGKSAPTALRVSEHFSTSESRLTGNFDPPEVKNKLLFLLQSNVTSRHRFHFLPAGSSWFMDESWLFLKTGFGLTSRCPTCVRLLRCRALVICTLLHTVP